MNKEKIEDMISHQLISEDIDSKKCQFDFSFKETEISNQSNKNNKPYLKEENDINKETKEKERDYQDENMQEFICKKFVDLSFLDSTINDPEEHEKIINEINEYDNTGLNINYNHEIQNGNQIQNQYPMIKNNNDFNNMMMLNNIYQNYSYYQQNTCFNNAVYNNLKIYEQKFNRTLFTTNNSSIKKKNIDKRYFINLMDIKVNKEKRTTIKMMNIPSYYTPLDLAKKLDDNFGISPEKENRIYDCIYIPAKKKKNKDGLINAGFAFINFVHPKHIIKFYSVFNGKHLKSKKSEKECVITFASKQGINIKSEDFSQSNNDKYIFFTDTKNHFQLLSD